MGSRWARKTASVPGEEMRASMTARHTTAGTRTSRQAACHRCGWTRVLTRIGRKERALVGSGRSYRWLCDECLTDLTVTGSGSRAEEGATRHARHGQNRKARSVA